LLFAVSGVLSNYILPSVATGSGTITKAATSSTITWSTPAAITYGTSLSAAQLNASSTVAGSFSYNPAAGTVLGAGTQTLNVAFTPTDNTDYINGSASVQLTVNQATPTIAWATPAAITYGTALSGAQLNATASVAGTFSYSPAGGVLTAGPNLLSVTFTPTDGTDYTPASSTVTLQVNQATPTITWATPAAITYGTALSGTQLNATASVAGTFSYSPAGGMLTAGSNLLSVTFTPTDGTDYTTASSTVTLQVNQATPMIAWVTPAAITYGTALSGTQLNATASVAGTFSYSPAGGVLTAGSNLLSVTFTPTDGTDYTTASSTVTLQVNQATPTIAWATPAAITYGTALSGTQLNATASVAGTFSYSPAGGVLTAGSHLLSVTFTPTDGTDYTTASSTVTLQVNQATPTITWATPAAITYGTALSGTQLNATASVAGTFSYSPAGGVLTAGSHLLSVTFTPTDGADYTTASSTVTLQVNQATPTITWATPASFAYGTHLSGTQLNATASVAGTFSYSPTSGTVLTAGSHLLSVTFTPTDGADYTTASAVVTQVVTQVTPTITWANPGSISYGTHLSGTQLNATASVAGTFSYNPAAGSVLTAGSHVLMATFTPTDTTDYTTATATASISITPIALSITAGSPTMIYGSALPTIAPSYSGFIAGDSATSLTTQPTCTTTATSTSNVGSYATSCTGAVDANYVISYIAGSLTVTPAVLTVAANKLSFAYGGGDGDNDEDDVTNPMTYTITGFAPGQTAVTDLTGTPSETSNTPEGGPVGSYTITMAAGSLKLKSAYSRDYTITYVSAPLVITPAVLTVTATSQSDVYGAVDSDNCGHPERHLTYTITGFAYNQSQNQVLNGTPTESTTATAKSNVGTYPITITQGSLTLNRSYASDYTVVYVNGTLTVTPAKLYVVANSYSRQINTANPAFAYTINGFVNGDTQSSATTGTAACCSTTATTGSAAGDYPITIAQGSLTAKNGNYTLNFVNGALVVYNPRDRNDPHCDGFGNYRPNPQFDHDNWPDNSSYNFYWGNGGGGPNINNWNWQ